jgi:hypothetical protein
LFDYELQVKRLGPDALRLFGCPYGGDQAELLSLWSRLSSGRRTPYLLTSVSLVDRPTSGQFFPRLFALPKPVAADAAAGEKEATAAATGSLVEQLRAGAFGLSSGAVLAITEARRASGGRAASTPDLTLSVAFATTPDVKARTLFVWSEKGLIRRESLGTKDGPVGALTTAFDIPADAKWLRLELRGTPPRAAFARLFDRGDGIMLATTNFVPLASFAASGTGNTSTAPLARRAEEPATTAPVSTPAPSPAEGPTP